MPYAIRYPRGNTAQVSAGTWPELEWGRWEWRQKGDDVVILAGGKALEYAEAAATGLDGVGIVNARFVKPLDEKMLTQIARRAAHIITVEDNTVVGGFGSAVLEALNRLKLEVPVSVLGIPDEFQEHATAESVHARTGIDAAAIRRKVDEVRGKVGRVERSA